MGDIGMVTINTNYAAAFAANAAKSASSGMDSAMEKLSLYNYIKRDAKISAFFSLRRRKLD